MAWRGSAAGRPRQTLHGASTPAAGVVTASVRRVVMLTTAGAPSGMRPWNAKRPAPQAAALPLLPLAHSLVARTRWPKEGPGPVGHLGVWGTDCASRNPWVPPLTLL